MVETSTSGIVCCLLILAVMATTPVWSETAPRSEPSREMSPRLAALSREMEGGDRDALTAFWRELRDRAPLIEAIPGDTRQLRVTFLWLGDELTNRVTMLGGFPDAALAKPLTRLPGTDLWYRTETHPTEARFQYIFQVNGPETLPWDTQGIRRLMDQFPPRLDPLNPQRFAGWSYVELPDAPPQPWIQERAGVRRGKVVRQKISSKVLNAEYSLKIYTPPGYEEGDRRSWLMVAFDGGFPLMEVTLDNLFASRKIPSVVVVGVENISGETRDRDLKSSEPFARFLADELVPWARQSFRVHTDAARTIVGGISRGGLMAVYCGLTRSQVFGKVLAQSGSFLVGQGQDAVPVWSGEDPGLLARQAVRAPRRSVEFYLEAGRYETYLPFSLLSEARRLRDVLEARGYRVTYSEFVGGHNEVCWRGSFADAMMALTASRRR